MCKHLTIFAILILTSYRSLADEDWAPPYARVEKAYEYHDSVGRMRAVYSKGGEKQTLELECRLFKAKVPLQGLRDLPRPNWGAMDAFTGGAKLEPYVYISVPLFGPAGESWEQTWVIFHFDSHGKMTRQIKRFVPEPSVNGVGVSRMILTEWKIGARVSGQRALDEARQ